MSAPRTPPSTAGWLVGFIATLRYPLVSIDAADGRREPTATYPDCWRFPDASRIACDRLTGGWLLPDREELPR